MHTIKMKNEDKETITDKDRIRGGGWTELQDSRRKGRKKDNRHKEYRRNTREVDSQMGDS